MKVKGKILKWGNSWGLRLDKAEAIKTGLAPDDEVEVDIRRKLTLVKDVFGTLKKTVDTQKALDEIDELFED
ncbi:hypothetical protein HYU11_04015 [Candidatus Woesearchaeota archaeon]|nr:hypothetical protein [Candidatus Woesearchaeota archaeon]